MTRGELIERTTAPAQFGDLLRLHRLAGGLTQEGLAERAGLSVHGIQKLESGTTHPYRDTTERLIRALQLSDQDEVHFKLAARPTPRRLQRQSPTAVTSEAARTNLPISATSFVARTGELDRLKERLQAHRLLTLTGSGGCGKTRLALEVARQLESQFIDGVWLIELAPLTDAMLVHQAIATSLGIQDVQGRSTLDVLTDYLRGRHLLLIIDNCEHLIEACAEVADTLLRSCAHVQLLATSRELLGVAGEATWRVASLSVAGSRDQADGRGDPVVNVLASESGRLFVDRAQLAVPSFAITPANASAVAQVCQRLDGIPLAIELAASWVSMLSVDQIAARLDHRFRLLTGGNRTAVRRQQTLQATIDWSYRLLTDEERSLVRRLAVFAGGWPLDAAEALGADGLGTAENVLQLMSRLVAKSIVVVEEPRANEPSVVRYRFLETIRQYAGEKLLEAGEASAARDRHRDHFLAWAERAGPEVVGRDQLAWLARLDAEHDNLRAALEWTRGDGSDRELRLTATLAHFWLLRGHATEGRARLRGALERGDVAPSRARAVVLDWLGYLEFLEGDQAGARALFVQAADVAEAASQNLVLARALRHLAEEGSVSANAGSEGCAQWERALAVARSAGDRREIGFTLSFLGWLSFRQDDQADGQRMLAEACQMLREVGDRDALSGALRLYAAAAVSHGDYVAAQAMLEEAVESAREMGQGTSLHIALIMLGELALAAGDLVLARVRFVEALQVVRDRGQRGPISLGLRALGGWWVAASDYARAARIFGAEAAARGNTSIESMSPPFLASTLASSYAKDLAGARAGLDSGTFAGAWAAGEAMSLADAVADALNEEAD